MAMSNSNRFKGQTEVVSYGDPSSAPITSDFDKARAGKPSPNMAQKNERFKDNTPSYGDPGAFSSSVDLENQKREQKLAHQRAQAEAAAARVQQQQHPE